MKTKYIAIALGALAGLPLGTVHVAASNPLIGKEISVTRHLQDDEEYQIPLTALLAHGKKLFTANWTRQEGGGRPLTKGTGAPLSDPSDPLAFPRNFNRISGPEANSCFGCHNSPFGIAGGAGDIVANVFVLGQRFDFATFDGTNTVPTKSTVDERGVKVDVETIANSRATLGMFGSGFIEMVARQMTADLQAIRDAMNPGDTRELTSKGVSFGKISRLANGAWDVSAVEGISAVSLVTGGATNPPSLVVRPFHQAGRVVSIREFTNNAFNHHHGIQSTERFGKDTDPDGDGFTNELTRADVTAVAIYQATMAVPGRMIPNDPETENAVLVGEAKFQSIGCTTCHRPHLPLDNLGWKYSEPNPFNPPANLRVGDAPDYTVDLTSDDLPAPRLKPASDNVLYVSAFTDLKLHDICVGAGDPNGEVLDMNQTPGSPPFFEGNRKFITRKLWDLANKPNFFHHGKYTTIREAVLAHGGEALTSRQSFQALNDYERDCVIEFLKTLQVLAPGSKSLVVDENGNAKVWPPARFSSITRSGGTITLQWAGTRELYQVDKLYWVEKSTDLNSTGWQRLGALTNATWNIDASKDPQSFFRLRPQ